MELLAHEGFRTSQQYPTVSSMTELRIEINVTFKQSSLEVSGRVFCSFELTKRLELQEYPGVRSMIQLRMERAMAFKQPFLDISSHVFCCINLTWFEIK